MPDIVLDSVTHRDVLGATVFAKINWRDKWEPKPHVFCTRATWSVFGSLPTAQLFYSYGKSSSFFDMSPPPGKVNRFTLPTLAYVRIDFEVYDVQTEPTAENPHPTMVLRWHGVAGQLVDAMEGGDIVDDQGDPVPAGTQTINCVGMEWLLENTYVVRSAVHDTTRPMSRRWVSYGHTFNARNEVNRPIARFTMTLPDGSDVDVFMFQDFQGTALRYWSTRDIVEYFAVHFAPTDSNDQQHQKWILHDPEKLLPDWDRPVFNPHDHNVLHVLQQLATRQRGLGLFVDYFYEGDPDDVDENPTMRIVPYTYTHTDVAVNDERHLPANPNQIDLTVTRDRGSNVVDVTDAFSRFHFVTVQGGRAVFCFSIADLSLNGHLDLRNGRWLESDYADGGRNYPNYPTATDERQKQQEFDRRARARPELYDTYRNFELVEAWDQRVGNEVAAIPDGPDPDGNPYDTVLPIYLPEISLAPSSPFQVGDDYLEFVDLPEPRDDAKYEPHKLFFETVEGSDVWADATTTQILKDLEGDSDIDYRFSVRITPRDNKEIASFDVNVVGGPQHLIDKNFVGTTADPPMRGFDWKKSWFTISVVTDYFCSATEPELPPLEPLDMVRELRINAGDKYRLDFVAEGTVYDVHPDGHLRKFDSSKYIRNDTPRLREIAKFALAWYGIDRRQIQFSTTHVNGNLQLGQLIDILKEPAGDVEIRAVITAFTIDIPFAQTMSEATQPGVWRIDYQTTMGQLDILSFYANAKT